ncbi:hypothetical protein [Leisingera methylohalidivorans]|uniref:Uncharacterized protein n=1 Tax=Leisingera methylohalidivorans DSM 14336 TaxID=999552 RepID=V9VUC0_9RHOB|nr:hypothetical protein [Leisingera methylohalidivorans]AHD00477.1 hypothetical protein METH_06935 [Leisingera methylohalidivorans DSM 14336]
MNLNDVLQELMPVLVSGLSVFLSAMIAAAAHKANQRWGLDIEARHREALHSAIMSGIKAAIEEGPEEAADVLISSAVGYAKASVPDAIARLSAGDPVLQRLARGKLIEATGRYGG